MRHIFSFQRITFARSSRRHRIGHAHALHVMQTSEPEVLASQMHETKLLWVGVDDRGLELEVIGIEQEAATLLVIHVMPYAFRRQS